MADLVVRNSHGDVISRPPTREGYVAVDAFIKESIEKGAVVTDGTGDTLSRTSNYLGSSSTGADKVRW